MAKYRIIYKNTSLEAPEGEFLVGRSDECHLVLDDPSVSRIHFAIDHTNNDLFVQDKGSRNGVMVNDVRVKDRQQLHDGDLVKVGHQTVRILSLERVKEADRTVGLGVCGSCGAWVSSHESTCSRCGARQDATSPMTGKETMSDIGESIKRSADSVVELKPISMMAGLALKAIHVSKLDEAGRLVTSAVDNALIKLRSQGEISDDEFKVITEAILALAEASKNPAQVSWLFQFHEAAGRLMSRETVEKLYDVVRATGYRACPEMGRYLAYLDSLAKTLSPGERFVHRRLQGLVKVCS
ncbi:MAG: FHA domain-containing protein [Deltaproteobacteria bacterium]|nr:FHA domain-containing protein [Deltaproteobacteria bacterium]